MTSRLRSSSLLVLLWVLPALAWACPLQEQVAPVQGVSRAVGQAARFAAAGKGKTGLWLENTVLPYDGDWLDSVAVLGGLSQRDHLPATHHDAWRCSAMVGLASSLVAGPVAFEELLTRLDAKRGSTRLDGEALARARTAFENRALTAGDLHRVADALYRAYIGGVPGGGLDGQISYMVAAGGQTRIHVEGKTPLEMLGELPPGAAFPLSIRTPSENWHVNLLWRDREGALWIYDSDKVFGRHLIREDLQMFKKRYVSGHDAEWPLKQVYAFPGTDSAASAQQAE